MLSTSFLLFCMFAPHIHPSASQTTWQHLHCYHLTVTHLALQLREAVFLPSPNLPLYWVSLNPKTPIQTHGNAAKTHSKTISLRAFMEWKSSCAQLPTGSPAVKIAVVFLHLQGGGNIFLCSAAKAPEPQGGTSATSSCFTIPQVFNALPPRPFLWYHRKLDESCQPLQRWNPALGLFFIVSEVDGVEYEAAQQQIPPFSVLYILKHAVQLTPSTGPSEWINLEFLPLELLEFHHLLNKDRVSFFSPLSNLFPFPVSQFSLYFHHPRQTAWCYNFCYLLLEGKGSESPREKDAFMDIRA